MGGAEGVPHHDIGVFDRAVGLGPARQAVAAGMLVGIPALALYHYFRGRIERFVFEMEEVSFQLVEELSFETMRTKKAEQAKEEAEAKSKLAQAQAGKKTQATRIFRSE